MEKVIPIDGKEVGFKSSASFILKYQSYFGQDGLKELSKLSTQEQEADMNAYVTMFRILWVLAKNYDKKIPPLEDWLEGFEDLNVLDVFEEVEPLIEKSFAVSEKLKNESVKTSTEKKSKNPKR